MTRTRHAVLFLGGWGLIAAVYVAGIVGCMAALPTRTFIVPETAWVLTDNAKLIERACTGAPSFWGNTGCFTSHPRVVYCLRAETTACVTEFLHAAGLDHAQIRAEGF